MKSHYKTVGTRSAECGRSPTKRKYKSQLGYSDILKKIFLLKTNSLWVTNWVTPDLSYHSTIYVMISSILDVI